MACSFYLLSLLLSLGSKHKSHMEVLIGAYDKIYMKYIEVLKGKQGKRNEIILHGMRKVK